MDYFDLLELLELIIFAPFVAIGWIIENIFYLLKFLFKIFSVPVISIIVTEHKAEIISYFNLAMHALQSLFIR
ncbi:hypothetical protein P7D33_07665 [Lactococcus petauri]|uniref:hypothetical protein n=1 Tax=Lactococcus petauri TaxID=1940789 RepID=UPI00288DEEF5|nr:hypothetical protein [Lactococcus petauri]MDT2620715.1 hypothetical protein [Lactococcus petauri]